MIDATNPTTWHWQHSLATWRLEIPIQPEMARAQALAASTRDALAALGDFGAVGRIEWASTKGGDRAGVASPTDEGDVAATCQQLSTVSDLLTVRCYLDLAVADTDGTKTTLRNGATLWLDLDEDVSNRVFVAFRLHVDIHAPTTWGLTRDNQALAAVNGPRLTGYLRRLSADLGAVVEEVDAPPDPIGCHPVSGAIDLQEAP